jgi:hypothetical protein
MKLKKEIVLGVGCKFAIAVCLVALATGLAHATTYYSGKGAANGTTLSSIVKWYTDESRTTLADPQPTPTANDGNTYVFLESMKMTGNCSFPEGTHVWFGTTTMRWAPNCQSVKWTIPDCTIYGISYLGNHASGGGFYGNYRLVKTGQGIAFGSSNLKDNTTYGLTLSGTFTGESDVVVSLSVGGGYTGDGVNSYSDMRFDGDFSGYKGKFSATAWTLAKLQTGGMILHFKSESSMGDPSSPFTDALTIRHRSMLQIDEAVTQTSARGITLDLSAGQFASLYAPSASTSWTLRAPLYGCVEGTLKKDGAGTVTLAGPMTATNLHVAAGTLVVDTTASFAAGTVITVESGAKLIYKRLGATPIVTVVVEEGGSCIYSSLTDIPFDGTDVETVDCTAVTAAERAAMPKPISVSLSQAIPVPFSETNRLAIATFDEAAGFTAADFTDATAKSFHRLPTAWLETATENGVTTLYLVARPAVEYVNTDGAKLAAAANWSDGKLPHAGKDYFSRKTANNNRTGNGSAIASYSFNGESLTFDYGIAVYAQNFFAKELRIRAGNTLSVVHASNASGVYSTSYKPRIFRGLYDIDASATDSSPAALSVDLRTTYADLQAELVGTGTFRFYTATKSVEDGGEGIYPFYFTGMSTNFLGRLDISTAASTCFMDMYVTNGAAFGGPLPMYSADAVRINPNSGTVDAAHAVSITAMADTTVDAANRGWHMVGGTLGASNGVTFVFAPPTLTLASTLCKRGGGTLALGCDTIGAGTAFAVEEGYVKALSAGCCTNLDLAVSAGAGIKADFAPTDATVAAKGLIAKSILPAEAGGTILVAPDIPSDFDEPQFAVVACTVPAAQADLTDTLQPAYVKGYKGRIEKDAVTYAAEGLVTYTVTWTKTGLAVIFR